jgi:hypothetical protein
MTWVNFENRNWSFAGDKQTWARIDTDDSGVKTLTVQRANRGTISSAYEAEMASYCSKHGLDFGALGCGCRMSTEIR